MTLIATKTCSYMTPISTYSRRRLGPAAPPHPWVVSIMIPSREFHVKLTPNLLGTTTRMTQHYDGVAMPHRPKRARPPSMTLTERQRHVLRLIADGKTAKSIARELGVSTTTVLDHIERIKAHLGATNRTNAAVIAVREGLLNNHRKSKPKK
jgi:DNA-binding NarL/FixJ family response regulator